jgi:hypothetical protein
VSEHAGLLGALTEALEIVQTSGVSWEQAREIQKQQAIERVREYELATAESNVVPFRRKH